MESSERSEILRRLDELSDRVAQLEARAEHRPLAAPPAAPHPAPTPARPIAPPPRAIAPPLAPAKDDDAPVIVRTPMPPPPSRTSSPKRSARPAFSLESFIGGKGFAALGAVVIVAGLALALKLAYDQGWLGRLPAPAKCLSVTALGVALLVAGEWARRRINALASAGLSAAGVGALFTSAYFAHHTYGLYGSVTAYGLLALSAAIGVFVAARARLALVAGVSLACGYLGPMLLESARNAPVLLPAHLLTLMAVGLTLSAWLGPASRGFRVLRAFVWWGTVLLGYGWTLGVGVHHPIVACAFLALVWGGVHIELMVSARREPESPSARSRAWRPIATSLTTTAWSVWLGAIVAGRLGTNLDWLAPAAGVVACSVIGLVLAGGLRLLRDKPANDAELLGGALLAQAGALLAVTIALGVGGWMQAALWLAIGVAGVAAGRWALARPLVVYGLITLSIGTARLVLLEWWTTATASTGSSVLGLFLSQWTLLVALAGGAWLLCGAMLRARTPLSWRQDAHACMGTGVLLLLASLIHDDTAPYAFFVVTTIAAVGAGALARRLGSGGLGVLAFLLLGVVTVALAGQEFWKAEAAARWLGLALTRWTALAWGIAGALAAGWALLRSAPAPEFRAIATSCLAAACVLLPLGLLHRSSDALSLVGAAVLGAFVAGLCARALRSRVLEATAMIMLAIAVIPMTLFLWRPPGAPGVDAFGLVLTRWTALGFGAAAAWGAVGLMRPARSDRSLDAGAWIGVGMAALVAMASLHHPQAAPASVVFAWTLIGSLVVAARGATSRVRLELLGAGALLLAAAYWSVRLPLAGWGAASDGAAPGLHPGLWSGVVCAGALAWSALVIKRRAAQSEMLLWLTPAIASGALLFGATSCEVARAAEILARDTTAQAAAVSIWWGLFAVLLLALGFAKRVAGVRHAGLALLMIALVKTVLVDLADISPAWRVASFIGLGALMLGVAVAYAKLSATVQGSAAPTPPEPA